MNDPQVVAFFNDKITKSCSNRGKFELTNQKLFTISIEFFTHSLQVYEIEFEVEIQNQIEAQNLMKF